MHATDVKNCEKKNFPIFVVTLVRIRGNCNGNLLASSVTRDRCYDFKNIFAEKSGKKFAFLIQNKAKLCKILIIKLAFEKNAKFFAEHCQKSQIIVIGLRNVLDKVSKCSKIIYYLY
jgi:hypothetical protein